MHRFRLVAPPSIASVEFDADDWETLMVAALEARRQLEPHDFVLLQVWSEGSVDWCDPRYHNEPRQVVIRAGYEPYPRGWLDRWSWCMAALDS